MQWSSASLPISLRNCKIIVVCPLLSFLKNHREFLASMDFKVTFDWRARPLYILCVLSHHRRQLIHCRCTYHPSAEWVAQQMREAFPFDEAPAKMLMDHDSIFLPVIKSTLPAMGIGVVRTTVKRPWQNGTIERFNRTLKEELLAHIIPISDGHLNRLLGEFKTFYNTARPHQANDGLAPDQLIASNDVSFVPDSLRVEEIPWLAGLHHSYRRVV
jgi:putative transposase